MPMFKNAYECPCGHTWNDEWDCTCDDRCPQCNTSCSPSFSYDLDDPAQVNEMNYNTETLEEHTARMKRISDEVKADIKAGRYSHGQIHPHIRGNYAGTQTTMTSDCPTQPEKGLHLKPDYFDDLYMGKWTTDIMEYVRGFSKRDAQKTTFDSYFKSPRMMVIDESHHRMPESFWIRPTKEKDWDQKTFKSGPATTPNEAVRQKRREERKRKKGSK